MTRDTYIQLGIGIPVQLVCAMIFIHANYNNVWYGILTGVIGSSVAGIVNGLMNRDN